MRRITKKMEAWVMFNELINGRKEIADSNTLYVSSWKEEERRPVSLNDCVLIASIRGAFSGMKQSYKYKQLTRDDIEYHISLIKDKKCDDIKHIISLVEGKK